VECAFRYKKTIYDYLKAFDDQSPLAKYRPGKALMISMIEFAIKNNYKIVDMLRGGENYKFELASEQQWTHRVIIQNPENNFRVRYNLFLFVFLFFHLNRSVLIELNIIKSQLKNYGINSLFTHYMPEAAKRIKSKLFSRNNFTSIVRTKSEYKKDILPHNESKIPVKELTIKEHVG
jgi:hypothetical protein